MSGTQTHCPAASRVPDTGSRVVRATGANTGSAGMPRHPKPVKKNVPKPAKKK